MKMIGKNRETGKAKLRMDKRDWLRIAEEAGWRIPDEVLADDEPIADPKYKIEVKQYGERDYWIYLDGELLAILKYTQKAMENGSILEELAKQIGRADGRIRMVGV